MECFVFSATLNSTVDTSVYASVSSPEEYEKIGSFPASDFRICSRFFVMLGSTADTYCVSARRLVSLSVYSAMLVLSGTRYASVHGVVT